VTNPGDNQDGKKFTVLGPFAQEGKKEMEEKEKKLELG
jgi:hypothetical protein